MNELIAFYIGLTLPMAVLVFAGSYFGIWKRTNVKLPGKEAAALFFFLWVLSALLMFAFHLAAGGADSAMAKLWGPLIVGVIIGRYLVNWRRDMHATRPAPVVDRRQAPQAESPERGNWRPTGPSEESIEQHRKRKAWSGE